MAVARSTAAVPKPWLHAALPIAGERGDKRIVVPAERSRSCRPRHRPRPRRWSARATSSVRPVSKLAGPHFRPHSDRICGRTRAPGGAPRLSAQRALCIACHVEAGVIDCDRQNLVDAQPVPNCRIQTSTPLVSYLATKARRPAPGCCADPEACLPSRQRRRHPTRARQSPPRDRALSSRIDGSTARSARTRSRGTAAMISAASASAPIRARTDPFDDPRLPAGEHDVQVARRLRLPRTYWIRPARVLPDLRHLREPVVHRQRMAVENHLGLIPEVQSLMMCLNAIPRLLVRHLQRPGGREPDAPHAVIEHWAR